MSLIEIGTGLLKTLQFEKDFSTEDTAEIAGTDERGGVNDVLQLFVSRQDVFEFRFHRQSQTELWFR